MSMAGTAAAKQRVLVTGASGFLGRQLVDHLARDPGVVPVAGSRAGRDRRAAGEVEVEELHHGDLSELPDLTAALKGLDAIVHCAARAHVLGDEGPDPLPAYMAINCDAVLALARQAAAAGVGRFIFISSIGVNGNQTHGTPFRHDDPPAPHAPYAVSKLAAETGLAAIAAETGLEVVILRLPLVLGPEPVGNLASLSRLIGRGIPLPFGAARHNRRSLVTGRTVAELVRVCLDHPGAVGETFLVADSPALHLRGILQNLARETGQSLRLLPVPVGLLRAALAALGKTRAADQLFGDLEIDTSHTTARLDWTPSTKLEQD